MTGIKQIARATGALFDVAGLQLLDDSNCNVLLVSDRTLYLLQQFALNEVNWLARYVEEYLPPGFYVPVDELSPDADFCKNVARLYRLEVNDLSCDIVAALEAMNVNLADMALSAASSAAFDSTGGGTGAPPPLDTSDVPIGEGQQFETQEEYFAAKCIAANALFDTITGMIAWLDSNSIDVVLGVFGGITSGLIAGALVAGPVGWALVLGTSLVVGLASFLISYSLDFEDIGDALDDTHEECVKALFNANDASAASAAMVDAMAASGTYSTTSAEQAFVAMLLNQNLTNQLFAPREDTLTYISPDPVDCTSGALVTWTFDSTDEGFTFSDESDSGQSATGVWSAPVEGWRITNITVPAGTDRSRGRITKSGLSIAVTTANSIQMDCSATSDGLGTHREIKVTYSDVSTQSIQINSSTPSTTILNCNGTKTINKVELTIYRFYQIEPRSAYTDIEEARIQ